MLPKTKTMINNFLKRSFFELPAIVTTCVPYVPYTFPFIGIGFGLYMGLGDKIKAGTSLIKESPLFTFTGHPGMDLFPTIYLIVVRPFTTFVASTIFKVIFGLICGLLAMKLCFYLKTKYDQME